MVSQVTIIGILMIVNGALCTLYGMLLMFMGPVMSSFFNFQAGQAPPQAQPQMQQMQQMMSVVSVVYVIIGAAAALAGVMNIAGGISALRFRSRTFVIIALFFNVAAFTTCYCLPTSLGLMIWGLIVMFQSDVAHAFTLGASGYTVDEIKQHMGMGGYPRDRRGDDWDEREGRGGEPRPPKPPPKGPPGEEHIYGGEEPPAKSDSDRPPPKSGGDEGIFEK